MNYIYGSIYIFSKKFYNYLISVPVVQNQNDSIIRRTDIDLPWYIKYKYFFSNATEIVTSLFLGSSFNAYDIYFLRRKRINVIINITDEINNFYETDNSLTYYRFPIRDNNLDEINTILNESYNIIDHHLKNGDKVLVHCYMGASRSASVVIYYMMKKYKISYKKALEIVKTLRPVVNLTEKFHNTLNSILV
jgi:hypothetical protein